MAESSVVEEVITSVQTPISNENEKTSTTSTILPKKKRVLTDLQKQNFREKCQPALLKYREQKAAEKSVVLKEIIPTKSEEKEIKQEEKEETLSKSSPEHIQKFKKTDSKRKYQAEEETSESSNSDLDEDSVKFISQLSRKNKRKALIIVPPSERKPKRSSKVYTSPVSSSEESENESIDYTIPTPQYRPTLQRNPSVSSTPIRFLPSSSYSYVK